MAAEKRPASNAFGSSQLVVKRQKSNVNLSDGKAVSVTNGNAAGGALTEAVSYVSSHWGNYRHVLNERSQEGRLMERTLGATHEWAPIPHHGVDR